MCVAAQTLRRSSGLIIGHPFWIYVVRLESENMNTRKLQDGFLNRSENGAAAVNRLLATLPKNEYKRLLPKMTTVNLVLGEKLYEPGEAIKYVYFPNDSIISLISELSE